MELLYPALSLLWSYGVGSLFGIVSWGIAFAVLGAGAAVVAWMLASRSKSFHVGIAADRWLHVLVLGGWLITLVPAMGSAGLLYGTERAILHVLDEEQAVARICSGASTLMIEEALREAAAETDEDVALEDLRVELAALHELREDSHAIIDRTIVEIAEDHEGSEGEPPWVLEAKYLVAKTALQAMKEEAIGGHDDTLIAFLDDLEEHQADDGTVGAADVTGVIATRWLEPPLFAVISATFASARYTTYAIVIGLLALPFGLAALTRKLRGPAS